MMDLVATAMLPVLLVLTTSLFFVKKRRDYPTHKRLQVALCSVLGVVITLFEIEVRTHDWRLDAMASRFYDTLLFPILYGHLAIAISTTGLWTFTLFTALKGFRGGPARPGSESLRHRRLGRAAALFMYATALSGWTFFWVAFVA